MTLRLVDDTPFGAEYKGLLQDLQKSYQTFIGDPIGKKYMMNRMKKLLKTDGNGDRIVPEAEFSHKNADCLRKKGVPWLLHSLPDGFPFIDSRSPDGLAALRAARNATSYKDHIDVLNMINNLNFRYQFPDLLPRDQFGRLVKLPIFKKHKNILANPDGAFGYMMQSPLLAELQRFRQIWREAAVAGAAGNRSGSIDVFDRDRDARAALARINDPGVQAQLQRSLDARREQMERLDAATARRQAILDARAAKIRQRKEALELRKRRNRLATAAERRAERRAGSSKAESKQLESKEDNPLRRVNQAIASDIISPAPSNASTDVVDSITPKLERIERNLANVNRAVASEISSPAPSNASTDVVDSIESKLATIEKRFNSPSSVDSPSSGESKSPNAVRDLNPEFVDDIGNPTDIAARISTFQRNVAREDRIAILEQYMAEMAKLIQQIEQNSLARRKKYVDDGEWTLDFMTDNYKNLRAALRTAKNKARALTQAVLPASPASSDGESKYQADIDTTVTTVNKIKSYSEIRSLLTTQRDRGGALQLKPYAQQAFGFILPDSDLKGLFQQNKQITQWKRALKGIKQSLNGSNPEDKPECQFDDTGEGVEKWVTQRFRLMTRILYLDPRLQLDKSISNSDLIRFIESNFQTGFASNEKVKSLKPLTRKNLSKLADPDLHMIQMDLAYTSDKKIYTI